MHNILFQIPLSRKDIYSPFWFNGQNHYLTKHKAETSQSEATIYIHVTQRDFKQDIVH